MNKWSTYPLGRIIDFSSDEIFSPTQIRQKINERSQYLRSFQIPEKNKIVFLHNNSPQFFFDFLAAWDLDLVPVPLGPGITPSELDKINRELQIHGCIKENGIYENLKWGKPDDQETALVLLSSGTTGFPKAIFLSEGLLQGRLEGISALWGPKVKRGLCMLSTSFGHGLIANSLSLLLSGRDLVISKKFDLSVALSVFEKIESLEINAFSSVPSFWPVLERTARPLDSKKSHLKEVHCASAPLDRRTYSVMRRFVGETSCFANYGLTEMGSWITNGELPLKVEEYNVGWVGKPIQTSIGVDEDRIIVKPIGHSFRTYDMMNKRSLSFSAGSRFDTGDLGSFLGDELIIQGRFSDFINRGGEKISPFEIEAALKHHPNISEVVAFRFPDENLGETVAVCIAAMKTLDEEEVRRFAGTVLGKTKIPEHVFFADNIEKSDSGKISRSKLSDFYSKSKKI